MQQHERTLTKRRQGELKRWVERRSLLELDYIRARVDDKIDYEVDNYDIVRMHLDILKNPTSYNKAFVKMITEQINTLKNEEKEKVEIKDELHKRD